jgi:phosphate transport system protein
MSKQFDQELSELTEKLLTMASRAERAIQKTIEALVDRNDRLAEEVKREDSVLDQFEIDIDEMAITLLALKAPIAGDLRLITTVMKISRDLERVGDEATTIARRTLEINQESPLKACVDIPRMAAMGLKMLRASIEAFTRKDSRSAREIIPKDKEVDALNKQLHRELVSFVIENPATTTRALSLMVISKSLERIADHATNIAEEVVYLYEGGDIRHGKEGLVSKGS